MPTIHLSLPEKMYEELRRKAEEWGMQITDLVKMFIKKGLEGELEDKLGENEKINERVRNLEEGFARIEEDVEYLNIKVARIESYLYEILKRLDLNMEDEEEEVEILKSEERE
ncbi:MAG: hypothetical protein QXV69_04665 [Sulfolobaceae archaeon]